MLSNADVKVSYHSYQNIVLETFQRGGAENGYLSITENIGKQYSEPQNLGEFDRPIEMLCGYFNKSKCHFAGKGLNIAKKAQWHHTKRQQLKTFLLFEVCV